MTDTRPLAPSWMRSLVAVALAVAFSAQAGCRAGASAGNTVTPAGDDEPNVGPDPDGRQESDNVGDLEARLRRLSGQHAAMSSSDGGGFAVCEDLCELSSNICSVKEKLCDLADRHPGDEEYQTLCREARNECREATESCVDCAQSGPTAPPATRAPE